MLVRDFDFDLPEELIAQEPPPERAGARMLALDRETGATEDRLFLDLPSLLRAGDVLVVNDSRVLPARLYAVRGSQSGRTGAQPGQHTGQIEVLLTEQQSPWEWKALVRPGRKVQIGEQLLFHTSPANGRRDDTQRGATPHGRGRRPRRVRRAHPPLRAGS